VNCIIDVWEASRGETRSMPAKKLRVEVYDWDGNKYSITFEGKVTRDKVLKLFDIIEALGGVSESDFVYDNMDDITQFDKVKYIIEKYFPVVWFKSKDVAFAYEQEFGESIKLSTVSTYLARLVDKGFLIRKGSQNSRRYRIATEFAKPVVGRSF